MSPVNHIATKWPTLPYKQLQPPTYCIIQLDKLLLLFTTHINRIIYFLQNKFRPVSFGLYLVQMWTRISHKTGFHICSCYQQKMNQFATTSPPNIINRYTILSLLLLSPKVNHTVNTRYDAFIYHTFTGYCLWSSLLGSATHWSKFQSTMPTSVQDEAPDFTNDWQVTSSMLSKWTMWNYRLSRNLMVESSGFVSFHSVW